MDTLLERLGNEKVLYTTLPPRIGFHTPLLPIDEEDALLMERLTLSEGTAPVWSATSLEPIPTDKEKYVALLEDLLRKPVYFRGLLEKLYDEQNVRVFIQVGLGSLVGFAEDTLRGRDFSAVAGITAGRSGIEQLRRVLAALFVEGSEVDIDFLGVKPMYRVDHSLIMLPSGAPPVSTELPELVEIMTERYGTAGPRLAQGDVGETSDNPILAAASLNMREVIEVQNEMTQLFGHISKGAGLKLADSKGTARPAAAQGSSAKGAKSAEKTAKGLPASLPPDFERPLQMTYEEHPYLIDHAIARQPEGWECTEDLNPVVPLAMTIELLSEIAKEQMPDRKLIRLGKMAAYRWIGLDKPFAGVVKGSWKKPNLLELSLDGYVKAEFTFGDEWPEPPQEYLGEIDVGPKIMDPMPTEVLYDKYSFHGPQYFCSTELLKTGERGMINYAQRREGKGSLLDVMGQQLGLFLHLTQTKNVTSFPVRLESLDFYADVLDQEGTFEHTMIVTKMTEYNITGNMVLKREGKIWAVARGFVCQRFNTETSDWRMILKPQRNLLVKNIAPGVYHYSSHAESNLLGLFTRRFFNSNDRADMDEGMPTKALQEYFGSRVSLKDAVRDFVRKETGADEMLYPVEVFCAHDERGKPSVYGIGRAAALLDGLHVSLSHKGHDSVAIVAREPVGIDIEKVEEKAESFSEIAFTERERELLAGLEQPQGTIRFWVAKEACAKKAGTGLEGNPKRFEVTAVDGDMLIVGDERVTTMSLGDDYIVGWTI
jgi:phosphopantetheinyl transferase (holo-ACP synthase)